MTFDVSFLNLELEAAKTGNISKELLSHPAFEMIAKHEEGLKRPVWDEKSFRERFAEAKVGHTEDYADWGLAPLFQDREKIEELKNKIETEPDSLTKIIDERVARFTAVPQNQKLCCVAYVGSYDGGFSMEVGSNIIYLNLSIFSCEESFLETLVHESYHARMESEEIKMRRKEIEDREDPIEMLLFTVAEEGIANFIGYNGATETKYPVIPLRTVEEGSGELKQLLQKYAQGEMTGQETLEAFAQTDCCYTGGSYIAKSVWDKFGRDGLELWSAQADLKAYYKAFRETPKGIDWAELS